MAVYVRNHLQVSFINLESDAEALFLKIEIDINSLFLLFIDLPAAQIQC